MCQVLRVCWKQQRYKYQTNISPSSKMLSSIIQIIKEKTVSEQLSSKLLVYNKENFSGTAKRYWSTERYISHPLWICHTYILHLHCSGQNARWNTYSVNACTAYTLLQLHFWIAVAKLFSLRHICYSRRVNVKLSKY